MCLKVLQHLPSVLIGLSILTQYTLVHIGCRVHSVALLLPQLDCISCQFEHLPQIGFLSWRGVEIFQIQVRVHTVVSCVTGSVAILAH